MITFFRWNQAIYDAKGTRSDNLYFPYAFRQPIQGGLTTVLAIEYNWWGKHFTKSFFAIESGRVGYVVGKHPHIPLDDESLTVILDGIFKDPGNLWRKT